MEFRELIDKEELTTDSKRLADWKRNAGKAELIEKIDDMVENFISNNVSADDCENITLIYKLANEIKKDII